MSLDPTLTVSGTPSLTTSKNADVVTGGAFGSIIAASPQETLGFYGCSGVPQQATSSVPGGPPVINLLTATTYAVGASSTITNTVTSTAVTGNLYLTPGSSVTNFPPGTVSGTQNIDNPAAVQAAADVSAAYTQGTGLTPYTTIAAELAGTSLAPGYYYNASGFTITGTLTLTGPAGSVWVFKSAATLVTAVSSSVVLAGGALPQDVYWLCGSAATIDVSSVFVGTVIAVAAVTANTSADITGRLFSTTAAVNFDNNTLAVVPAGSSSSQPVSTVAQLILLLQNLCLVS